jgi:hypothetical protein
MRRGTKTVLNLLYLLFAAGGFILIFYTGETGGNAVFLLPTAMIGVYGIIVMVSTSGSQEERSAEHHIDTIYYLGFLYTLMSLVTLFYRLNAVGTADQGDAVFHSALYYVGVSVTTSIAGILFRSMARGHYLKDHGGEDEGLERSYRLLKEIAEEFSHSYRDTFETIKLYLDERTRTAAAIGEQEQAYLEALRVFSGAVESFSRELTATGNSLAGETGRFTRELSAQGDALRELSTASDRVRNGFDSLPLAPVADALAGFRTETGELNGVLDGLIELLERKVERVS